MSTLRVEHTGHGTAGVESPPPPDDDESTVHASNDATAAASSSASCASTDSSSAASIAASSRLRSSSTASCIASMRSSYSTEVSFVPACSSQDSAGDDSCAGDGDRRDRGLTMRSSFHMPSSDVDGAGDASRLSGVASGRWCRSARVTSSASMSASSRRTPSRSKAGDSPAVPPRALERMAVRLARTRSMTSALSRS